MENVKDPKISAPEDICVVKGTEELAESGAEIINPDSEKERHGKTDMGQSECDGADERSKSLFEEGGYNRGRPPEDDCCPICFDEYHFPCRSSCGHWFCTHCILEYWRYSTNFKPCKCPMCSCLIDKLVPESSMLIQGGQEVGKTLNKIQEYNRLISGGCAGFFLKALALPMLIRRRSREYLSPVLLRCIYNFMRLIGLLLGMLYESYDFQFFPNGALGIQVLFEICGYALVILIILDVIWNKWMLRRRARHLAQLAGVQ